MASFWSTNETILSGTRKILELPWSFGLTVCAGFLAYSNTFDTVKLICQALPTKW